MRRRRTRRRCCRAAAILFCAAALVSTSAPVHAQGTVGKRFFPATLASDDPFVADELTLPSFLHLRQSSVSRPPRALETRAGVELSKRLTPSLGVSLGAEVIRLETAETTTVGFDNVDVSVKYQLFTSEAHEAIVSVALDWEIGGTGRKAAGAESFDIVSPTVLGAKGFGDLPDGLSLLKPLAVTGVLGPRIPSVARQPVALAWGGAVEYSLPYLESFVRDLGLPAPLDGFIPIVEFAFETPMEGRSGGRTVGTINPGIIWDGEFFQIGLEAVVPVNARTGKTVGVRGALTFFLDRLFPGTIGRPLFGKP